VFGFMIQMKFSEAYSSGLHILNIIQFLMDFQFKHTSHLDLCQPVIKYWLLQCVFWGIVSHTEPNTGL